MQKGTSEVELGQVVPLEQAWCSFETLISRSYLDVLNQAEPIKIHTSVEDAIQRIQMHKVIRIVYDKKENNLAKFNSLFSALSLSGSSIFILLQNDGGSPNLYIGVRGDNEDSAADARKVLECSLRGNFPGAKSKPLETTSADEDATDIASVSKGLRKNGCIAIVTGVPSLKKDTSDSFSQGLEKIMDAMGDSRYAALLLATPIGRNQLAEIERGYQQLCSDLSAFNVGQVSLSKQESLSVGQSVSEGLSVALSKSVSIASSSSVADTEGKGKSATRNYGGSVASAGAIIGGAIGSVIPVAGTLIGAAAGGAVGGVLGGLIGSKTTTQNSSTTKTRTETETSTDGRTETQTKTQTVTETSTESRGSTIQFNLQDRKVVDALSILDEQLKRIREAKSYGAWNWGAYFLAPDIETVEAGAQVYSGILRGEQTGVEHCAVSYWVESECPKKFSSVMDALSQFRHPSFDIGRNGGKVIISPTAIISTTELSVGMALPQKSLPDLPVFESVEFGRSVSSYDGESEKAAIQQETANQQKAKQTKKLPTIKIGSVYHLGSECNQLVDIDVNSLSSHLFVTGSTGAGKSNTVYVMLDKLLLHDRKFLVIEPAKGEYRNVFGGRPSVDVYGTNPDLTPLLRINPFSFPHGNEDPAKNVHILEHLDRLVEIFNVCWPMYAAMPAVLKEAIEKSYEDCGWNLTKSTNRYELEGWRSLYPTFTDVTRNIRRIIDSSEYDAENKGAYKGSLITRLKSLTNGINGLVFTTDEISAQDLFDKNVIVDLSRVGSIETKALIMGLLVLKLQEHRMTKGDMNAPLKHVTVLEEAHNLLKRTSTEQTQDSGNLLGKSVEMLANSIAEMRTYGEGFVIADQAPGLLDMAAIRNTNTKIVMRLPDQGDRELVGKAMHLNDDQIAELAKLPRGVAAVYQNEWVESVLCKVDHYTAKDEHMRKSVCQKGGKQRLLTIAERLEIARLMFSGEMPLKALLNDLKNGIVRLSARSRILLAQRLKDGQAKPQFTKAGAVVAEAFFEITATLRRAVDATANKARWTEELNAAVTGIEGLSDDQLRRDMSQAIITEVLLNEMGRKADFNAWYKGGFLK